MTVPISVKKPDKMVLIYDNCTVELECHSTPFKHFIFYADEETLKRLEEKDIIAGPEASGCGT